MTSLGASRHAGVPYALDAAGQVADPDRATAGQAYRCLACEEQVSPVRAYTRRVGGNVRRWRAHFAHRPGSSCHASGESIQHQAFKLLLKQALEHHRALTIQLTCPDCRRPSTFDYVLPPEHHVHTEVRVERYRADVAVLDPAGHVDFAVEGLYAHRVPEAKALDLSVPWVEVPATLELLLGCHAPPVLTVTNSNLYVFLPCVCGNDAASFAQAQERQRTRQEQERQRVLEERAAQQAAFIADDQRRRIEAAQRRLQERQAAAEQAVLAQREQTTHEAEARRFIGTFLSQHVPEINQHLLVYTCVMACCPNCDLKTVFFDPGGMNMMPTWTPLAWRATAFHPLECVCVGCGWHSVQPPPGVRVVFRGVDAHPVRRTLNGPDLSSGGQGFWWQEDD